MQQASRISDKTAFFLLGELIEYGETTELFANPKIQKQKNILLVDLVDLYSAFI